MKCWKESLIIGVPQIDTQHRKLVETIDLLMQACMQGKGQSEIETTLNFTLKYTLDHFRDEESLQLKYAYPGYKEHKKIHEDFTKDVIVLAEEFKKSGPSVALTAKINQSLLNWVINHICTEDKKVGEHIQKVSQ